MPQPSPEVHFSLGLDQPPTRDKPPSIKDRALSSGSKADSFMINF
jgi:hypothetical protein